MTDCALDSAGAHRTAVSAEGWSLWRVMECRSAGFPAQMVLGLGDPDCAAAADAMVLAQDQAAHAWAQLRADIKTRIRDLLEQQRRDPTAAADMMPALRRAAKSLDRQRLDAALCLAAPASLVTLLRQKQLHFEQAKEAYRAQFAQAAQRLAAQTQALARDGRFREAVTWQNAQLVHSVLDLVAESAAAGGARLRRAQELVASYAQRYCTKNDTIGFFGPVGWAQVGPHAGLMQAAQRQLLASRRVYFEDWTMHALARRLSADTALLPWMTARRMPYLRLDGLQVHGAGGSRFSLTPEQAAVFALCDGRLTARQIGAVVLRNPFLSFDSEQEVLAALAGLAGAQRIELGFFVRVADAWPERHLRAQLDVIAPEPLRQRALAGLDALEVARAALATAAGSACAVAEAFSAINQVFEDVAEIGATRRAGQTYGARTIVYEDCRRAMDVVVGDALLAQLQRALDPVLASARWFCHQLAQLCSRALQGHFDDCIAAGAAGVEQVDLPSFWLRAQALFFGPNALDVAPLQGELSAKWESLLGNLADAAVVSHDSAALAAAARALFEAPDCGWRGACHQSPDIMLAVGDAAALVRGEGLFVLGEVHLGLNTLINQSAVNQFERPAELMAMLRADRGTARLLPLLSREATQQPIRVQTVVDIGHDVELCFAHDARPLDSARALDIANLVVEHDGAQLVVLSRDGHHQFALLDVFGELLSGFAADKFHLLAHASYRPRVLIDRLVIQRQTWRRCCADLPFAAIRDEQDAYLALRRWQRVLGMPRWVFVKLPWERKPFYLDFDSPLYCHILCKQIRAALEQGTAPQAEIAFSEMLPAHRQSWLADADGKTYTSELRMVAVHADDLPCQERPDA